MKVRVLCIALLVLALASRSGPARAQAVFNLNMLGGRMPNGDVHTTALGGDVQLVPDTLGVLQVNPAALAYTKRVTLGASVFSTYDQNTSPNYSDREGALKFTTLTFAFSPAPRLSIGVGYRANYDPSAGFTIPDTTVSGAPFINRYERTGSMISFPFTVAVDLGRLKLGGYVSVENGTIEGRWSTEFRSPGALNSFSNQRRDLSGNGWGVGFDLAPWSRVGVSLSYEAEIDYDTDVIETFTNDQVDNAYRERTILPAKYIGSVRWYVLGMGLYAGASYRDFTKFQGLAFPSDRTAEEMVGAAGVEFPGGLRGLPLRLSATYEQLPYTLPAGENVNRFAITAGTGLRLGGGRGKIDIALQFAQTGSLDKNQFETRSVRLFVGIAGAEAWQRGPGRR